MSLATIWFQPDPALITVWSGPSPAVAAMLARGQQPADVPVVIGPRGVSGPPGVQGATGPLAEVPDPGDLMLYFSNGLT